MNKSESITKLATALNKVQSALGPCVKNASNPFFKSNYADLTAIWQHVRGPLTDAGLSICQTTDGGNLITTLMHVSGEYISGSYPLGCKDAMNPQAMGSAMSYARRYALAAIVCAVAENDDDDGNSAKGTPRPFTVTGNTPPVVAPKAVEAIVTPPVTDKPKRGRPAKVVEPVTPVPVKEGCISREQAIRMFAIANEQSVSKETLKAQLADLGIESSKDIPVAMYDDLCEWLKNGGQEPPKE